LKIVELGKDKLAQIFLLFANL